MLATLATGPIPDDGWIYERKLDGQRCLGFSDGQAAGLRSRSGRSLDGTYPELAQALASATQLACVVDGEIVAFEDGATSFSRLQGRMQNSDPDVARQSDIAVHYYLFDLLYLDGYDTTALSLLERKHLLLRAVAFGDAIRFSAHRDTDGGPYLEQGCAQGWEGIIAKDGSSAYEHRRSRRWLKFKCVTGQEFVVAGFTDPRGSRVGFGALLLGYYDDGRLVYAGRVGTGFDVRTASDLARRLQASERATSPFDEPVKGRGVHWVRPALVAQVGFTEWTRDGRLRHPRYLGLRTDKDPRDVRRETAGA